MPLSAQSKERNLTASVLAWLRAKLVTIEGLSLVFAAEPVTTRPAAWVHADVLWGLRRQEGRVVGSQRGALSVGLLNLNLCVQRAAQTNLYAMATLRDTVSGYVQPGQAIPLVDYTTAGTPTIGALLCTGLAQNVVDDGLGSGVMIDVLSVDVSYTEAFTHV